MQLEIKPIVLEDKPLFDNYFSAYNGMNSEYTFTNMFMWRKSYNIRYAIIDGALCIFSKHGESPETVNFPIGSGNIKIILDKLLDYFDSIGQPPLIRIYNDGEIDALNQTFPDRFIFTEDRNSFDYVYKVSDLVNLTGSQYHSKRNHINQFVSKFDFEYQKITEKHLSPCFDMFEKWCNTKEDVISDIHEQRMAVKSLIENFDFLGVTGGCILVDGQLVAFSFGEVLSPQNSVAVIHLEHADTDFQGSFPLINQQFLENEWNALSYVNREEDMGLPGLRRAKKSYKPCLMVKKYIASLKKQ